MWLFQSTRPIRGATTDSTTPRGHNTENFNPRAPYGARLATPACLPSVRYFNPRAPYGARLWAEAKARWQAGISIHAPHTGRDGNLSQLSAICLNFNPRAPYGARRTIATLPPQPYFNPRAPYGARRGDQRCVYGLVDISIHAPHTGRDNELKWIV